MIKTVILDLSEVLIPGLIGIEERLEAVTGTSRDRIAKALGSHPYHEVGNNLESLLTGEITYQEYRSGFMLNSGLPSFYEETFDKECLSMFESPYTHTNEMVRRISGSCDLYLLSDHCEIWATHIQKQHDFFRYFKGCLWSYEVGGTKKSEIPFKALISKYALSPPECLFVDDNQKNVAVARSMGFITVHFVGPESVAEVYRAMEDN